MKYIQSGGGYYYKQYKNGKKVRISKRAYNKKVKIGGVAGLPKFQIGDKVECNKSVCLHYMGEKLRPRGKSYSNKRRNQPQELDGQTILMKIQRIIINSDNKNDKLVKEWITRATIFDEKLYDIWNRIEYTEHNAEEHKKLPKNIKANINKINSLKRKIPMNQRLKNKKNLAQYTKILRHIERLEKQLTYMRKDLDNYENLYKQESNYLKEFILYEVVANSGTNKGKTVIIGENALRLHTAAMDAIKTVVDRAFIDELKNNNNTNIPKFFGMGHATQCFWSLDKGEEWDYPDKHAQIIDLWSQQWSPQFKEMLMNIIKEIIKIVEPITELSPIVKFFLFAELAYKYDMNEDNEKAKFINYITTNRIYKKTIDRVMTGEYSRYDKTSLYKKEVSYLLGIMKKLNVSNFKKICDIEDKFTNEDEGVIEYLRKRFEREFCFNPFANPLNVNLIKNKTIIERLIDTHEHELNKPYGFNVQFKIVEQFWSYLKHHLFPLSICNKFEDIDLYTDIDFESLKSSQSNPDPDSDSENYDPVAYLKTVLEAENYDPDAEQKYSFTNEKFKKKRSMEVTKYFNNIIKLYKALHPKDTTTKSQHLTNLERFRLALLKFETNVVKDNNRTKYLSKHELKDPYLSIINKYKTQSIKLTELLFTASETIRGKHTKATRDIILYPGQKIILSCECGCSLFHEDTEPWLYNQVQNKNETLPILMSKSINPLADYFEKYFKTYYKKNEHDNQYDLQKGKPPRWCVFENRVDDISINFTEHYKQFVDWDITGVWRLPLNAKDGAELWNHETKVSRTKSFGKTTVKKMKTSLNVKKVGSFKAFTILSEEQKKNKTVLLSKVIETIRQSLLNKEDPFVYFGYHCRSLAEIRDFDDVYYGGKKKKVKKKGKSNSKKSKKI